MKTFFWIAILSTFVSYSQESFKKSYWIREYIKFEKSTDTTYLNQNKTVSYNFMKTHQANKLDSIEKYYKNKQITITDKHPIFSNETFGLGAITITDEVLRNLKYKIKVRTKIDYDRATLKFKDNYIIVNPYLKSNRENNVVKKKDSSFSGSNLTKNKEMLPMNDESISRNIYRFKLLNRQTVRFWFDEAFFTAITLPIKYRLRNRNDEIPEDFSGGLNVNVFFGYGIGFTKFMYREGVDNIERHNRLMIGPVIGTSIIELNKSNTSPEFDPETKFNKGVLTMGLGLGYSIGKIQMVGVLGWDNALGNESGKWIYDNRPWLGFGVGFELFK